MISVHNYSEGTISFCIKESKTYWYSEKSLDDVVQLLIHLNREMKGENIAHLLECISNKDRVQY